MDRTLALFERLSRDKLHAVLIQKPEDIRYFSGYRGEGMLLLSRERRFLITDFRYLEQAQIEAPEFELLRIDAASPYSARVLEALAQIKGKRMGYDEQVMNVALYKRLKKDSESKLKLRPVGAASQEVRACKDANELDLIRKAAVVTQNVFNYIVDYIKPGMTEKQIALEMNYCGQKLGADGEAFDFIVASGPNASMPHAIPSDRAVNYGDVVTLDFGCKCGGYCSDMTRTIAIGEIPDELKRIYEIVKDAQQKALESVRSGVTGAEVDAVARDLITAAGYGDKFGHGLGHGVGLEIHELPRLARGMDETVLEPGNVVTVEPGIYIPELGGVRIEDTVIVTEDGCENLFTASKELITI